MVVRFGVAAVLIGLLAPVPGRADELAPLARSAPMARVQPAAGLDLRPSPMAAAKETAPVGASHHSLLWFWLVVGALAVTATVVTLAAPPPPQPYRGNFGTYDFP